MILIRKVFFIYLKAFTGTMTFCIGIFFIFTSHVEEQLFEKAIVRFFPFLN